MFAQMFPGMEWIPVILLAIVAVFACVVVGGSILVARLLPLGTFRPELARDVRRGIAALIAIPILLLAAWWFAPLGGPDPRQRIALGMSAHEVRQMLGKPHEQNTNHQGHETWIYYRDWVGMEYYLVEFNREGRVNYQMLD